MSSWWRLIALEAGAGSGGTGSWVRRAAEALGATDSPGRSWSQKIANFLGPTQDVGPWDRRQVYPDDPGTVGSWARRAYETGSIAEAAYSPALDFSDERNSQYIGQVV